VAIINNAHPGSQIRLICTIDRVLNRRGGKPILHEDLVELLRPQALPQSDIGAERFRKNLDFWLEEGLWQQTEAGISRHTPLANERNLPSRVLRIITNEPKSHCWKAPVDSLSC
jgi:hypothetical protein